MSKMPKVPKLPKIKVFHHSNRTTLSLDSEALEGRLSTGCERSELACVLPQIVAGARKVYSRILCGFQLSVVDVEKSNSSVVKIDKIVTI